MGDCYLPNQCPLNARIPVTLADGGLGEGTCLHESLPAYAGEPALLGAGIAEDHGRKRYSYPTTVTLVISL